MRRCCGGGKPGGADEELNYSGVAVAYAMMADSEMDEIRKRNLEAAGANQSLARRVRSGDLLPDAGVALFQPVTKVQVGRTCAKWHASKHVKEFMWRKQNTDAKGHKYLSLRHPKMVEFRKAFQMALGDPKVCGRLVLNIDHVFKFKYRPAPTKVHKERTHANPQRPPSGPFGARQELAGTTRLLGRGPDLASRGLGESPIADGNGHRAYKMATGRALGWAQQACGRRPWARPLGGRRLDT